MELVTGDYFPETEVHFFVLPSSICISTLLCSCYTSRFPFATFHFAFFLKSHDTILPSSYCLALLYLNSPFTIAGIMSGSEYLHRGKVLMTRVHEGAVADGYTEHRV